MSTTENGEAMPSTIGSGISLRVTRALAAPLIGAFLLPGCATLPDDGLGATNARLDELRNLRYCEPVLIGGDALAHDLRVAIYNTTDLNQGPSPGDFCPAAAWDRVEAGALQQHFEVSAVLKDGPRRWPLDWMELPVGVERDFNAPKARWMGELHPSKGADGQQIRVVPYRPTTLVRRSTMGFAKGRPVFFLEIPDGVPWVMLSYAQGSETWA